MMNNTNQTQKSFYRSTLALAIPVMISQLGHTLVQTADTIIVGQFAGRISLAAVSLAHAVFMIVLVLGLGISYGLTPLIAQENGRSNYNKCSRLLSNSLWLNILTAVFLFLGVYIGSTYAMQHSDQDPLVVETAKPYLFILAASILPLMIFNTFKQFAEGLGLTKQAMQITIWGNVLNVILAIVFVKGMFGLPAMGIVGVGIATLIDRILMMFAMAIFVFKSSKTRPYIDGFRLSFVNREDIKQIFKIGAPVALQYTFEIGAFATAAIIAGKIGALQQASHQVAITLASMTYMMAGGIASAATIKVGNNIGNNDTPTVKAYAAVSYKLVFVFMLFWALVFAIFNTGLPRIITQDEAVIGISAKLLIVAGIFQLFDGTQVVGLGILRGMGDVKVPTWITFFAYWVVGIPSAYAMGIFLGWGVNGVWYGLSLGLLTSSVLLFWRYKQVIKTLTDRPIATA